MYKEQGVTQGRLGDLVLLDSHGFEVVRDLAGLERLRDEWNEVAPPGSVEPWQTFAWVRSAAGSCCHNQPLRVIAVRKAGRLTAMAPLVLKSSEQPLRPLRLDFVGGEELKEPNRLVALDPGSLDVLVDGIVAEKTFPIRLSRIPNDDGYTVPMLIERFRKAGWITRTRSMAYPYLTLEQGNVKKSLREDLGRARRKAMKLGEVTSEVVVAQGKDDLLKQLQTAFRVEASSWKSRNRTAVLFNLARREFFESYAGEVLHHGILRLAFLKIDGEPVAMQIAVEAGNGYWLFLIGYDETYRECSPGNLLLDDTMRMAAKQGLARYNFLGKEEPWIKRWTSEVQDCAVIAAYRPNLLGTRAMLSDVLYLANNRRKAWRVNRAKKLSTSRFRTR